MEPSLVFQNTHLTDICFYYTKLIIVPDIQYPEPDSCNSEPDGISDGNLFCLTGRNSLT